MIKIDSELRDLLPALDMEAFSGLKDDIKADGQRDPLVVWEEENILVDGHHRYRALQELGVEPKVVKKSFACRSDVMDFMLKTQGNRRNMTKAEMSYARGVHYNEVKKEASGRPNKIMGQKSENFGPLIRTSEKLGEEYGVSKNTIKNDAKFAKGVEKLGKGIIEDVKAKKVTLGTVQKIEEWTEPEIETYKKKGIIPDDKRKGAAKSKVEVDQAENTHVGDKTERPIVKETPSELARRMRIFRDSASSTRAEKLAFYSFVNQTPKMKAQVNKVVEEPKVIVEHYYTQAEVDVIVANALADACSKCNLNK